MSRRNRTQSTNRAGVVFALVAIAAVVGLFVQHRVESARRALPAAYDEVELRVDGMH